MLILKHFPLISQITAEIFGPKLTIELRDLRETMTENLLAGIY